jgi:lambda family phage tail tape measure protein
MASQNIARLGVVLGLDTAEFTASIDKAIAENVKLKNAIRRETDAAAKEIVALKYATDDYGKTVSRVTQVEREMAAGRFKNATADVKKQLLDQAAAYDKIAMSAKGAAGAQFKMNEQQKIQLTYQTTDLVTQIASGQSPFIAILQQGGQLKDVMGGVGNMFKAIGTLFTPTTIGFGLVATAIAVTAKAAYDAADDLDKLQDALALTGNYSGVTADSFQKLANTLSGTTKASLGTTKEALMAVISSGQFTGESINAVTQSIIAYSQIAGVTATEAAQKLKGGLNGTAEGAKALNKEMNFLTLEQYKQIEALEKAGKKQEAAQLTAVALNTKLEQQRRELGILEGAWKAVTKATSDYYDQFKQLLSGPTESQTLASIDKQISDIQAKLAGTPEDEDTVFARGWRKTLAALKAAKENIQEVQRLQNRSASSKDVGNAKAEIDEYDKYKGMLKGKAAEVEKAKIDARFAQAKIGANELQMLELESQKKIAEAKAEMEQKNQQEDGRAAAQNLQIYNSKVLAIQAELTEKKNQIRTKNMLAEYQESVKAEEEITAAMVAEQAKRDAITIASQKTTQGLEYDKERLQLKYQMIYATEQEQKLAMISLEYARKRKEIEGSPDQDFLQSQLERQEALERLNVTIQESMQKTQQVFDSVWGNMSSAIDNFVKTGKLSMKDFALSVIRDLIAIQMKAAALKFLGAAFGMFSGYTAGGSAASNMPDNIDIGGGWNPARANGGPVDGGKIGLVGENGPELFIPSTAGTIIPNHALNSMGNTTNVTNNYINAIDTKSFEDRLLGSSNAIWAANQYANKNLATSFGRT